MIRSTHQIQRSIQLPEAAPMTLPSRRPCPSPGPHGLMEPSRTWSSPGWNGLGSVSIIRVSLKWWVFVKENPKSKMDDDWGNSPSWLRKAPPRLVIDIGAIHYSLLHLGHVNRWIHSVVASPLVPKTPSNYQQEQLSRNQVLHHFPRLFFMPSPPFSPPFPTWAAFKNSFIIPFNPAWFMGIPLLLYYNPQYIG